MKCPNCHKKVSVLSGISLRTDMNAPGYVCKKCETRFYLSFEKANRSVTRSMLILSLLCVPVAISLQIFTHDAARILGARYMIYAFLISLFLMSAISLRKLSIRLTKPPIILSSRSRFALPAGIFLILGVNFLTVFGLPPLEYDTAKELFNFIVIPILTFGFLLNVFGLKAFLSAMNSSGPSDYLKRELN